MNLQKTTCISQRYAYQGVFYRVRMDTLQLGDNIFDKEIIETGQGVVIACVTKEQKIVLIKQWRHNHGDIFELPAGSIDEGEDPLVAAKRELMEETGIDAKNWELISSHQNGVHQEGEDYFFLAQEATKTSSQSLEIDEQIELSGEYTFEEIEELIKQGQIPCLKTRACIWLTMLKLRQT